jgi:hypothetical protein
MILEAVWFKDGKEIASIDPVQDLIVYDEIHNISDIEVYNGLDWYNNEDDADEFVIRIKKENEQ